MKQNQNNQLNGCNAFIIISITFLTFSCQAAPNIPTNIDADFLLQGEYLGTLETSGVSFAAQVVAKGSGTFIAEFFMGGLPGAGADTSTRVEQKGTLKTNGVNFQIIDSTKEFSAIISTDGETLKGKTPKMESFTLKKILRKSPTLGLQPPPAAITIFNGVNDTAFVAGTAQLVDSLLLPVGSASSGATTLKKFGDFTLHLEFLEPYMPTSSGLARGNSGVYLQGRFELQVLDSFGLNIFNNSDVNANQECGAFYQLVSPKLNMSYPPVSWQTYDVEFTSAKFDATGKNIIDTAVVTVRLNGVVIHDHQKLKSNTLLGDAVTSTDGPLRFQAHGDPVYYRNIWVIENVGTGVKPALKKKVGVGKGKALKGSAFVNGRYLRTNVGYGVYLNRE